MFFSLSFGSDAYEIGTHPNLLLTHYAVPLVLDHEGTGEESVLYLDVVITTLPNTKILFFENN
jgi:hypothetical protein